jgi:2-methylcitrate dehydratase MmgE/PrpD-like protein
MTLTDAMAEFVVTATPPEAALRQADARLDSLDAALWRSGSTVEAAHQGGAPTAMNQAWRVALGVTGAEADGWPVIEATVIALQRGSQSEVEAADAVAVGTAVAEWTSNALATGAEGWSTRGIAGAIGAGVAAARLLGLDEAGVRNVIGLCATQAAGLRTAEGTEAGAVQAAKTAADAVEAVTLVGHGFTSSADGLGGRRGLFALLAPGATPRPDFGWTHT